MTGSLLLSNLAVYSLQIGVLVALAAAVPALVRMRTPGARLVYWHTLLAACLILPLVRPWKQEVVTATAAVFSTPSAMIYAPASAVHRGLPWGHAALWVLAAGVAVRLLWLAFGLWRLRQYRLRSRPFDTAYDANIRISPDVSSPVTFGAIEPVILIPERFMELPAAMRQAILCHEILHIERRDWLFTMAEEAIRALFWFHPAIWWVIGQIHLSREQAVDRRVIELTQERDPYVDALLTMAGARPQLDLAPAPLFLKKRHLKHRVVEILKEAKMSRKSLISALAASVAMLALACWLVTGAIPLAAEPQMVADAPGISVNMNGSQLMHRSPVLYPADAIAKGIQGTVVVMVKLDANGEVTDANVQSGPEELRKTVIQSVLNWHFAKDAAGSTRTVTVEFTAPQTPPSERQGKKGDSQARPSATVTARVPVMVPNGPSMANSTRVLRDIVVTGLSDQAKNELLPQLPVHIGDTIGPDQFLPTIDAVRKYDQHLGAVFMPNATGEYVLRISAPPSGVVGGVPGGVLGGIIGSVPRAQEANVPGRIKVGGDEESSKLVNQVPPVYPPLAKQARISGSVELNAVIGKDGHIVNLGVIKGHPLLVQAALDAVKQWVYQPTLLNGEPVEVSTTITVNFTLME